MMIKSVDHFSVKLIPTIFCFLFKQVKDNKPYRDGAIAITKLAHPGDDKALQITNKIHDDCDGITGADRCDFAAKLMTCTNESLIKQGIDPKKIMD